MNIGMVMFMFRFPVEKIRRFFFISLDRYIQMLKQYFQIPVLNILKLGLL